MCGSSCLLVWSVISEKKFTLRNRQTVLILNGFIALEVVGLDIFHYSMIMLTVGLQGPRIFLDNTSIDMV